MKAVRSGLDLDDYSRTGIFLRCSGGSSPYTVSEPAIFIVMRVSGYGSNRMRPQPESRVRHYADVANPYQRLAAKKASKEWA